MKFSAITLTLLLSVSTAFSISTEALARKGCIPEYDKNGCSDKGAPVKKNDSEHRGSDRRDKNLKMFLSKITQYEILAMGCKENLGQCGYSADDLKVGDSTNMILSKPTKGFKQVTYTEIVNNF